MNSTTQPYLRSQSALLDEIKTKLRVDSDAPRWSDTEIYLAMNEALAQWSELVRVAHFYPMPDGFASGMYEYALPSYIRPPVRPQVKRLMPYHEWGVESATHTWQEIPGALEPDGEGGQKLRLYAPPRTLEGRVAFFAPNSPVPTSTPLPELAGSLTSSGTTAVISSNPEVAEVGHLKINGEYLSYAGITRGTSTLTLNIAERGLYGTEPATHGIGDTVEWCVAADDYGLYNQLFHYVAYALHRAFQTDGGVHERSNHEKMMLYHEGQANAFWQGYVPNRPAPRLRLGRKKFVLG